MLTKEQLPPNARIIMPPSTTEDDTIGYLEPRKTSCECCKYGPHHFLNKTPQECYECGWRKERNEPKYYIAVGRGDS